MFFDLSRSSKTHKNNLITLFSKYYHISYFELRLIEKGKRQIEKSK